MRILPKDEKFFHLFNEHAQLIMSAASWLAKGVREGGEEIPRMAGQIRDLERQADRVIEDIYRKLHETFLTPIDPEDIHEISSYLDDVMDVLEDAAHRIDAYCLEQIPPALIELCAVIEKCASEIAAALVAMEQGKPVVEFCREIEKLEEEADQIERTAVAALFASETNPITLLKYKEIYEFLEITTDRSKDVAVVLRNVLVKNG
jgi:uncharacterized protein